jgi:hypothetical protein
MVVVVVMMMMMIIEGIFKPIKFWLENLKESDHFKNPGV